MFALPERGERWPAPGDRCGELADAVDLPLLGGGLGALRLVDHRQRPVAAFAVILVVLGVAAVLALSTLVGTQFIQTVGGKATAAWAGLGVLAVAVAWAVLVRWQGRPAAEIGVDAASASPLLFGAGLVLGVVATAAVGGLTLLTGGATAPGGSPALPGAGTLVLAGLAFLASALYQDAFLVCGMYAALVPLGRRWLAIGIPCVIFAAFHLGLKGSSALSAFNTVLYGIVLISLARLRLGGLTLAAPVGFHTAWNYMFPIIFGLPLAGTPSPWHLIRLVPEDRWWSGGAVYGPENGLAVVIVLVAALAGSELLRRRRSAPASARA
jgi:CAAX protease family protein